MKKDALVRRMFSRGVDVAAYLQARGRTFTILEHRAGNRGNELLKLIRSLEREFSKEYAAVLQ